MHPTFSRDRLLSDKLAAVRRACGSAREASRFSSSTTWRFHDRSKQFPRHMMELHFDHETRSFRGWKFEKESSREDWGRPYELSEETVALLRAMLTKKQIAKATAAAMLHDLPLSHWL